MTLRYWLVALVAPLTPGLAMPSAAWAEQATTMRAARQPSIAVEWITFADGGG